MKPFLCANKSNLIIKSFFRSIVHCDKKLFTYLFSGDFESNFFVYRHDLIFSHGSQFTSILIDSRSIIFLPGLFLAHFGFEDLVLRLQTKLTI